MIEGRVDIHWDEKMTLTHLRWRTAGLKETALAVLSPPRKRDTGIQRRLQLGGPESDG